MTARVIRAQGTRAMPAASASSASSAPFAASALRLSAEQLRARVAAERTVAAARAQAATLLDAAAREAAEIRAAARAEGLASAHAETLSLLLRAKALDAQTVERALPVVEHAVVAVAERLLAERIAVDASALAAWVRASIAPLLGARRLSLRAASSTLGQLASALPELASRGLGGGLGAPLELIADETLPDAPNAVIVARSDLGEVRLELGVQLGRMLEAIRPALVDALRGARG
jgi:flagellar biosynthesis/type III secretory pathway protein FliH